MSVHPKLKNHLNSHQVKYEIILHKKVFTALDVAATLKARLEEIAKSLVVKADNNYYLLILSSNKNVNLVKLKKVLKAGKVVIPKEAELIKVYKIKPGNLTGFGSLHKLPVVVDKSFQKVKQAIFSGGSLVESVKMAIKDYIKIEEPIIHAFAEMKKFKKAGLIKKTKRKGQKLRKQAGSRQSAKSKKPKAISGGLGRKKASH